MVQVLGLKIERSVTIFDKTYFIKPERQGSVIKIAFYYDNFRNFNAFEQEICIPRRWLDVIVPWPSSLVTKFARSYNRPNGIAFDTIPQDQIYYPDLPALINSQLQVVIPHRFPQVIPHHRVPLVIPHHRVPQVIPPMNVNIIPFENNVIPPPRVPQVIPPMNVNVIPYSPHTISSSKKIRVSSEIYNTDCDDECPICMNTFKFKDSIETGCKHLFCNSCFQTLMRNNDTRKCPICRQIIKHTFTYTITRKGNVVYKIKNALH